MPPKRKSTAQRKGPAKKKGRQEPEDNFQSTVEALKAAPTEKRIVRVDSSCPLSSNPGTQVSCDPFFGHTHGLNSSLPESYLCQISKVSQCCIL